MKSYTHWETAEDTKLFIIIPFRKKASPTLLIFCKQNPIHRTLVQRQSTGNLDLNNERKKKGDGWSLGEHIKTWAEDTV